MYFSCILSLSLILILCRSLLTIYDKEHVLPSWSVPGALERTWFSSCPTILRVTGWTVYELEAVFTEAGDIRSIHLLRDSACFRCGWRRPAHTRCIPPHIQTHPHFCLIKPAPGSCPCRTGPRLITVVLALTMTSIFCRRIRSPACRPASSFYLMLCKVLIVNLFPPVQRFPWPLQGSLTLHTLCFCS